mmetsp:Transcript_16919/g.33767  ORF Transcript_16919/g.33767 Transcript_16919/m.33767 type:complete len:567 (+) Transcript_16919:149-1849(+)
MALTELSSPEALQSFKSSNANALICFSATWCGPCKAAKPQLEALASEYQSTGGAVAVGIAYEHNLGDAVHSNNIRAFPTYVLFVDGTEKGRVEGVNFDGIRRMVDEAGCKKKDLGVGHSLGGAATAASAEDARAARLAKLGAPARAAPPPAPASASESVADDDSKPAAAVKDVEMEDAADIASGEEKPTDAAAAAADESMVEADAAAEEEKTEMVDPTESLNKEHLDALTSSMGFTLIRAQKGLLNGNGGTVEGAVEWLMQHQDDADIDEPIPFVPKAGGGGGAGGGVAQSYKCNECGKILSNMANLELHANKTGHSDFEESTKAVKPLTAEEKAKKVEEIKALLKAKRTEREEAEKAQSIESEKARRFMGQEMAKTREQMEREALKRDALMRKKEKEAARRERERLRAEIAKDKLERQANKGKLKTTLGADGYNPSAVQYDVADLAEGVVAPKKAFKADPKKIDEYITKVSSYKAGGDGQKCLKILLAYVGNVVDKPEEEKFRSINTENKAFKTKVKPFLGAKALLVAVGFKQNEAGDALVLKEDADRDTLKETKAKLEAAYAAY